MTISHKRGEKRGHDLPSRSFAGSPDRRCAAIFTQTPHPRVINPADHQVHPGPILGGLTSEYQLAARTLPGTRNLQVNARIHYSSPTCPARATGHFAHRSSVIPLPLHSTLTAQHGATQRSTVHDRIDSTRPPTQHRPAPLGVKPLLSCGLWGGWDSNPRPDGSPAR